MTNHDLLQTIRAAVQTSIARGERLLRSTALLHYLDDIAKVLPPEQQQVDPDTREQLRLTGELHLAHYRMQGDSNLAVFHSINQAGQSSIRAAMTLNGAAATAILALLGHLLSAHDKTAAGTYGSDLALVMLVFTLGALGATIAYGATYVTQSFVLNGTSRLADAFNTVAIGLVIGSYAAFGVGGWLAYVVLRAM